jgi:hypothetical protein
MAQSLRDEREARNQALFREVNERVAELNQIFDQLAPDGTCHVSAPTSTVDQLPMTMGEYEELRKVPTRFAVLPSEEHVTIELERVVEKTDRYWVVEKLGEAGEVAAELSDEVG